VAARFLEIAYRLRHHRLAGWGLDRWAITLAWGVALLILLLWWLRGAPPVPAWHWILPALLGLTGLGLLSLRVWAKSCSYVTFSPHAGLAAPSGAALSPADKLLVRATGRFEVEGRPGFFADLLAYWRTFASREHAVMAIAHRSRFLGVGSRPAEDVGMWYIFFRPETIQAVMPGTLAFGSSTRPALRIAYRYSEPLPDDGRRRARPKAIQTLLYVACEDEEARGRIWADLLADTRPGLGD
jgi:hypothetical protein